MAGDAVFQFQEGLQEIPFGTTKNLHISAGLVAAERGAKGDRQDVAEGMAASVAGAGGIQGAEQVGELGYGGVIFTSISLYAKRRWPLSY